MNPYEVLPENRFWKKGVVLNSPKIDDIFSGKFSLTRQDKIATSGSCFAQHIHKTLKLQSFNVLEVEPPPSSLKKEEYGQNGFDMYSARYGNIYTVKQLSQLSNEVLGKVQIFEAWVRNGRYYDSQRPNIDPNGYETQEEVFRSRKEHLACVLRMFREMDVFIFTLGLTEAWMNKAETVVYPTAPGVVSGHFDSEKFTWVNSNFLDIIHDFDSFQENLQVIRNGRSCKILLTVSPVPLTATYSDKHILAANTYSKSTLRSVAGYLSEINEHIDYFPSYELIVNPRNHSSWYEANLRSVRSEAVENVMDIFLRSQSDNSEMLLSIQDDRFPSSSSKQTNIQKNIICEEELLERFDNGALELGSKIINQDEIHLSVLVFGDSHVPSTFAAVNKYFLANEGHVNVSCLHHFMLVSGIKVNDLDWSNLPELLRCFKEQFHEKIVSWFNSKRKILLYTGLLGGNYAFGVLRPLAGERIGGEFIKSDFDCIPLICDIDEIDDSVVNSWKGQINGYNNEINKLKSQGDHSFHWIASPMLSARAVAAWAGAEYANHDSQSIYNKQYSQLCDEILGENQNYVSFPDKYSLDRNGFLDDRFQLPDRIKEDIHASDALYQETIKDIFRHIGVAC